MTQTTQSPLPDAGGSISGEAAYTVPTPSGRRAGFTLIELMGIIAVMTVMMLALMPALIRQSVRASRTMEMESLRKLGQGLRDYIVSTRQIPGSNTVVAAVAGQLGWLPSAVTTSSRGRTRYLIVDPGFRVGSPAAAPPFTQGTGGSGSPVRPRFLIIGSVGMPITIDIYNGAATSTNTFDQIWNSEEGVAPGGWAGGGTWEDIVIQRVNLEATFIPIILNNNAPTMGRYSVDNTNSHVALGSNPFNASFLIGTTLGLHSDDGFLQTLLVVQDVPRLTNSSPYFVSHSFVYEKGVWRGRLFMSDDDDRNQLCGKHLQSAYDKFMDGPANTYQCYGVTQSSVTRCMHKYMSNYVKWATNGFPSNFRNTVRSCQEDMEDELETYCNKKSSRWGSSGGGWGWGWGW